MKIFNFIILITIASFANAEKILIENDLYETYNQKLSLELKNLGKTRAEGFYSVSSLNALDGEFNLVSEVSGVSEEFETEYEFLTKVSGNFKNNKKNGNWIYSYTYNDGVDIYEKHDIQINFIDGKCVGSKFSGQLGHIMPFTIHEFSESNLCAHGSIKEKAWELWGIEYEKQKREGKL